MVGPANARVLAILTRAPSTPGKTRLFRSLQCEADPRLAEALLLDTLDGTAVSGIRRVVAVTPGEACDEVRVLVGGIPVMAQTDGDLGQRMRATMTKLFDEGAEAVVLVGADVPEVSPQLTHEAFERLSLEGDRLVLGPAADGGYYLVGARRVPPIFEGIPWGSPRVLSDTIRAATSEGWRVELLGVLSDVDTAEDLYGVIQRGTARRTGAWARAHVARVPPHA